MKRLLTDRAGAVPLPDLSRTKAAIEAYDAFDARFDARGSQDEVLAQFAKLEALGRAVGHAYGLDTSDRNSLTTCEQTIRPGPAMPSPGFEASFVRRMVARWEARQVTKKPVIASVVFDVTDVMESVAWDNDGVEPEEAQARAWLAKYRDALGDAMHHFAREWVRKNWEGK